MSRYIDADALRKEVEEIIAVAEEKLNNVVPNSVACRLVYTTQFNERDNFMRLVNWMPTAVVEEVRHGEWKKVYEKAPRYVCTACNHLFNNKGYKYCPNCGAKMDGERSENGKS